MKRPLMMIGGIALLTMTFSASAASLVVDAGVLQSWSLPVDLCEDDPGLCAEPQDPENPAPPSTTTIKFQDALFNPGGNRPQGQQPDLRELTVDVGADYTVLAATYDGYSVIGCPSQYTPGEQGVTYRFDPAGTTVEASGPVTHVLCYVKQTGSGHTSSTSDSSAVGLSATHVIDDSDSGESESTNDLETLEETSSAQEEGA